MPTLSIRQMIIAGFSLTLAALVVISGMTLRAQLSIQTTVGLVVNDKQPAVVRSLSLTRVLEKSIASLGLYMLSQDSHYKEAYVADVNEVNRELAILMELPSVQENSEARTLAIDVSKGIERLIGHRERLLQLAENPQENIPAIAHAAQKVNPLSRKVEQLLTRLELQIDPLTGSEQLGQDIQSMRLSWDNQKSALGTFLMYRNQAAIDELSQYRQLVEQLATSLENQNYQLTPAGRKTLAQIAKFIPRTFKSIAEVVDIHGGAEWRVDASVIRSELGPDLVAVEANLQALVALQETDIATASNQLVDELTKSRHVLVGLLITGLLWGIGIAFLTLKKVLGLILDVRQALQHLSTGDLTFRMTNQSSGEIGIIAQAFNEFLDQIQPLFVDIEGTASQLAVTSQGVAQAADQSLLIVAQQQGDSEQIVRSVEGISESINEVAESATFAADKAGFAQSEAEKGREIVGETIEAIHLLANVVNQGADTMIRLKEESERIDMVLGVITNIAEQTNLLALNAAIEAARAGEQGRGFAVVADEVRTLATRTRESTEEVQRTIESLHNRADNALAVMSQGRQQAESSVGQAALASTSLESIIAAVGEMDAMTVSIAKGTEAQGKSGVEIRDNITRISERVTLSLDQAHASVAVSEELASTAQALQVKVQRFRTKAS